MASFICSICFMVWWSRSDEPIQILLPSRRPSFSTVCLCIGIAGSIPKSEKCRPYRELRSCLDLTGPRDYSSPEEMVQRLTSASTVLRRVLDNPALQDYQENNGFGDLNCPAACTASPSPTGSTGPQARCREADTDRRETVPPQVKYLFSPLSLFFSIF